MFAVILEETHRLGKPIEIGRDESSGFRDEGVDRVGEAAGPAVRHGNRNAPANTS